MAVVTDDHLLLTLLSGVGKAAQSGRLEYPVYTTGCWYYRLTRAVMSGLGDGSLSGRFAALGEEAQRDALTAITQLPDSIGLLSYRTVAPVMGALRVRPPLNMLNAEATHTRSC